MHLRGTMVGRRIRLSTMTDLSTVHPLRDLYGQARERALKKELHGLDVHALHFIGLADRQPGRP